MVAAGARRNGLQWPLHGFQVTSWVLFIFFVGFFFGLQLLYTNTVGRAVAGALYAVFTVISVAGAAAATLTDPADSSIYEPEQQYHAREVVPGRLFCYRCERHVSDTSKHCTLCMKCVDSFDHHCIWLNNCVGRHNYRCARSRDVRGGIDGTPRGPSITPRGEWRGGATCACAAAGWPSRLWARAVHAWSRALPHPPTAGRSSSCSRARAACSRYSLATACTSSSSLPAT